MPPGGRGWAALDGQLRSGNENVNDAFPPLSDSSPVPHLQPIDVAAFPVFRPSPSTLVNNNTNNGDDFNSTVMPKRDNTSRSQSNSEATLKKSAIPVEPDEWEEEEDIYSRHRKEAVRATRSASRHAKAAGKAFMRGDHHSARQHSLAARHQHSAAQSLHADAAANILTLRNPRNDLRSLDLHGLHAAEAVRLLQQHLHRIETQHQKRPTSSLQVVTGVGNHSRGQASLPAAVRGFLNENGLVMFRTCPFLTDFSALLHESDLLQCLCLLAVVVADDVKSPPEHTMKLRGVFHMPLVSPSQGV